ncbi:bifunctional diaminohydroxyphosphoribosylaminopyrimidine deaminase/5-amino-6-(5-phosphoribosylamino)uracil reductase RibD [Teredinibacter haidensis]|uniref:bifunctional diaminohydroxyphosphoribosylaminopyrimidine deaminase/5-amino-6-(5-phosphoribosylamino)uracil reductase RibD n=1 Tax=Teredinibacter haidensis TaxID=2731755 RepID=UPI000948ABCF|nr:bifunctional diaminohydroxyphosphoribosylaminopyrimidine deaminase/5-amino-6-(5-phosphoribosylamino)uracil reductase RibD [Teredinibacter haidensis]
MSFSSFDREQMQRALLLAKQGLNTTTPNPRVGCVLVSSAGDVIGEGFHRLAGEGHAEVNALAAVKEKSLLSGATAYVTLEPCSHQGQTGPCADALIDTGIARLVYGMEDPNPQVAGRGLDCIENAGIQVDGPLMEDEARALNPGFIKRMQTGLPYIRCKLAMSLDGRTAMADGSSKWITGPSARLDVQRLRARSCAIITGVESVLLDDPLLTVRLPECERQPLRVIVDSQLRSPGKAEIFQQPGTTIVATCNAEAAASSSLNCWVLPEKDGHVDLRALLKKLSEEGCNEILLETGATLAGAFVARALVDEIIIYMAAKLMGSNARPLLSLPINTMGGALDLTITDVRAVGPDWRFTALPDPDA